MSNPSMQLLGWAATRAAEAVVDRFAGPIAAKARARAVAAARQRASVAMQACRKRLP